MVCLGDTNIKVRYDCNGNHNPKESNKEKMKDKEAKVVVSQIP